MKVEEEKMKIEKEEINNSSSISPQKRLYEEFSNFLKKHSVYETIPENMKVIFYRYSKLKNLKKITPF